MLFPFSVAPRVVAIAASGVIHAMVFASLVSRTPERGNVAPATETNLILEPLSPPPSIAPPIEPPTEPVSNKAHPQPRDTPRVAPKAAAPDFLARFMATVPGDVPIATGDGERPTIVAEPKPETTYGEDDVQTPARLLSNVDAAYPMPAWSSGIEADVPVEIIVDAEGSVASARVVTQKGHGFDDAALASVKTYRFTAAQRDGHPVRVRVRWSVQFRLRR